MTQCSPCSKGTSVYARYTSIFLYLQYRWCVIDSVFLCTMLGLDFSCVSSPSCFSRCNDATVCCQFQNVALFLHLLQGHLIFWFKTVAHTNCINKDATKMYFRIINVKYLCTLPWWSDDFIKIETLLQLKGLLHHIFFELLFF